MLCLHTMNNSLMLEAQPGTHALCHNSNGRDLLQMHSSQRVQIFRWAPCAQPAVAVCRLDKTVRLLHVRAVHSGLAHQEGHQGDGNEHGGSDGAHDIGPDARAVHQALEEGQPALEQGAVLVGQADLEVALQAAKVERGHTKVRSKASTACSCIQCMPSTTACFAL